MTNEILRAENITKIYNLGQSNQTTALKNISITINKGDFVCIMGTSGSGKTTLLNNISTIDIPNKGNVYIEDKNINLMSESELCFFRISSLGFVFQNYNLINSLTIMDNLKIPLLLSKKKEEPFDEIITTALKKLKIEDIRNKFPAECSGGQLQRVAIARSLINNSKIIIADEPTGNLDKKNSLNLMQIFSELNKEGITIILVTHDPVVASYSNRVIFLDDGIIKKTLTKNSLTQKEFYQLIMKLDVEESSDEIK